LLIYINSYGEQLTKSLKGNWYNTALFIWRSLFFEYLVLLNGSDHPGGVNRTPLPKMTPRRDTGSALSTRHNQSLSRFNGVKAAQSSTFSSVHGTPIHTHGHIASSPFASSSGHRSASQLMSRSPQTLNIVEQLKADKLSFGGWADEVLSWAEHPVVGGDLRFPNSQTTQQACFAAIGICYAIKKQDKCIFCLALALSLEKSHVNKGNDFRYECLDGIRCLICAQPACDARAGACWSRPANRPGSCFKCRLPNTISSNLIHKYFGLEWKTCDIPGEHLTALALHLFDRFTSSHQDRDSSYFLTVLLNTLRSVYEQSNRDVNQRDNLFCFFAFDGPTPGATWAVVIAAVVLFYSDTGMELIETDNFKRSPPNSPTEIGGAPSKRGNYGY
jgi:hypothetical protein